ncbi:MAG: O-antigen ligase family protein [Actinomycetota bacterium]
MHPGAPAADDAPGTTLATVLFGALVLAAVIGFDPWAWDEAGPLRWLLLSTLAALLTAVALAQPGGRGSVLNRAERVGIAGLAAGAAIGVAVAPERLHAVIGTPDRHFGALTWFLAIGVYLAMRRTDVDRRRIGQLAALGCVVLGGWTIAELAEFDGFDRSFPDGRAGGPFAQPAYLGAAAVLLGPLCALGATDAAVRRDRTIAVAGAVGALIALLGSGSRAALVGALVALVAVGWRRRADGSTALLRPRAIAAGVGGLAVAAVFTPGPGRFADALTGSAAVDSRLAEWRVGFRAWTDDPARIVSGWGPEGYRTVFGRFVDDDYVVEYGRLVVTDRAHAGVLDLGLSIGLIGLIGWSILIGSTLLAARHHGRDPTTLALFAGVVGYITQQLLLFPLAELDLVAFGLLGLLGARIRPAGDTGVARPNRALAGLAAIVAAVAAFGGAADVAADRAIAADPPDADRAVDLRPDSIRYAFIAARTAAGDTEDSLRRALSHIDDARDLAPDDPALRLEEATIRVELARLDPASTSASETRIAEFLVDDPRHPQLLMQHGIMLALGGELDASADRLREAVRLAPESLEPHLNLILVLLDLDDPAAAAAVLEQAETLAPSDPRLARLRDEISSR